MHEAFEIARQTVPTEPFFIDGLVEALDSIVARDDRERRPNQFRECLDKVVALPKYRDNGKLSDQMRDTCN
jgi:hypothetical protein